MQSNIMTIFSRFFRRPHLQLFYTSLFISLLSVSAAEAEPPELSLPIDCIIGETCWLTNFVDRDPGPKHQDYRCGSLSYNTHKGTDIALANDAVMQAGVSVLAAAPGRVTRIRDGEPRSTLKDLQSATALRGRECGNGLVIDHGDDWTTQYCHLMAGSLSVAVGDTVQRGDKLGRVGRSGRTEFPHIHLSVRKGKTVIDPFTGDSSTRQCNTQPSLKGLWAKPLKQGLSYPGPQPFHLGFSNSVPKIDDVRAGKLSETEFDATSPALVFWVESYSLAKGDQVSLSLLGPKNEVIAKSDAVLDRPFARAYRFTGRKRRGSAWDVGAYKAHVSITRGDQTISKSATAYIK